MRHPLYERIGRFVIEKSDLDELPDWLQQLMARVIVLQANFSFKEDGSEYIAMSPEFERTSNDRMVRTYYPVIEDGRFLRWSA